MKGKKEVIDALNEALKLELGAINQYWLHYRLLDDWGFTKLAKKERAESIEEMEHADNSSAASYSSKASPTCRPSPR